MINKLYSPLLFIAVCVFMNACDTDQKPYKEIVSQSQYNIQINHYLDLYSDGECSCKLFNLLGKKENETEWGPLVYIDGLDYEWGYIYELKIQEVIVKYNDPAYSYLPTTEYYLDALISKTRVADDSNFTLELVEKDDWNYTHIEGNKTDGFSIDGITIISDDDSLYDSLENINYPISQPGYSVYGVFMHVFDTGDTIKIIDLYQN